LTKLQNNQLPLKLLI